MSNEVDFMDNVIEERNKHITQIESIMTNVHAIAQDIGVEVKDQGKKLQRIDQDVTYAKDNVKGGNEQLVQAEKHQKSTWKCLVIFLAAIVLSVAIVLIVIFTR